MEFSLVQYAEVGAVLFSATLLQGTVGFAAGLFGVPLLLMVGVSLPQAVMLVLLAALAQTASGAWSLRREVALREISLPVALRLGTLPLGLTAMIWATGLAQEQVKQVVGAVLLAIVLVQWLWRPAPRQQLHVGWSLLAFGGSGFLLGLCGMGGPPMVLWVLAHDWSSARSRAFLFFTYLFCMVPHIAALVVLFGEPARQALWIGLLAAPLALLGSALGLRAGAHLPKHILRRTAYVLLMLIALSAILAPLAGG